MDFGGFWLLNDTRCGGWRTHTPQNSPTHTVTRHLHNWWYNSAGNGVVSYLMCMDLRSLRESGLQGFSFLFLFLLFCIRLNLSSAHRGGAAAAALSPSWFFFSFVLKTTTANRRLIWKALVFSFSLCRLLQFFFNQSFEAHTPRCLQQQLRWNNKAPVPHSGQHWPPACQPRQR